MRVLPEVEGPKRRRRDEIVVDVAERVHRSSADDGAARQAKGRGRDGDRLFVVQLAESESRFDDCEKRQGGDPDLEQRAAEGRHSED